MALTSNRLGLARARILRGPCRMAMVGDSISEDGLRSRMFYGLYVTLTPTLMTGVYNSAKMLGGGVGNVAGYTDGKGTFTNASIKGFGATALGGVGGSGSGNGWTSGDEAIWPQAFADSGSIAADIGVFTQTFDGAIPVANRSGCAGGDWMTGSTTLQFNLYSTTLGFTTGFGRNIDRPVGNSINFDNPDDGDLTHSVATNSSGYWTFKCPAGSGSSAVGWGMQATAENETNKRLYLLGTRYYVSETGLELQACATGSSAVTDHIDLTRNTQAAINAYVRMNNTNTVLIWTGENDGNIDTTWRDNVLTLISMWRTAIQANGGVPLFLLITQYETVSSTTAADIVAMSNYQRAISQAYPDVCWYGLGMEAGSFAFLDGAGYLADQVHPSNSGALYFAGLINSALLNGTNGAPGGGAGPFGDRRSRMRGRR